MKNFIPVMLIIVGLTFTGCGQVGESKAANKGSASVIPEIVSAFDIQEVGVGENGYVSLTNFTSEPASLADLFLCQENACFALPETIVQPGETVRIASGSGIGIQNVVAKDAAFGELRPSDGEIALTTSAKPNQPEQMLVYLEWGSTPHDLTNLAIEAGLWLKGGYAPTSDHAMRLFRVKETGLWLFDEPQP